MSESSLTSTASTTRLSGNWLLKQGVFLVVLLVFGFWGLADALYFYPRRGLEDASSKLAKYLAAASEAGRLTPTDIAVPDPKATHAELALRAEELAKAASSSAETLETRRARVEFSKFMWLEALARTWRLNATPEVVISPGQLPKEFVDAATRTVKFDPARGIGLVTTAESTTPLEIPPQRLLAELVQKWNTRDQVKPLSGYDMPLQWVFVVVGFGGGLWMLATVVRANTKKFRWDAASQSLTLPGGASFSPADVKEFDKRRWHKFFVTVHLKDGSAHTLDLLRYVPLEEWILAMERTAFPQDAEPEPKDEPLPVAAGNDGEPNPNNG